MLTTTAPHPPQAEPQQPKSEPQQPKSEQQQPKSEPQQLSAEQLQRRLDDLAPRVAVFDCDGTLWSGDAGSTFMTWTLERNLVSRERKAWLEAQYEQYKRGDLPEQIICGDMIQVYAGLRVEALREAARVFVQEQVEPRIFSELRAVVKRLQERGTEIWVVSSTNNWLIEEGVRGFAIAPERVLATHVACEHGIITDRLLDVPTNEGKVTALRRVGVDAPDAVFGNSVHDLEMLAIARLAVPTNPTPALAERSAQEGWAVFQPKGGTNAAPGKEA